MSKTRSGKPPPEIPVIGEVDDWEAEVVKALLDIPAGGECVFYINSPGGNPYGALAALTLMRHRRIEGTAIVLGECSSAAILLFAACRRRLVTPHSIMLFHRMRWQSEKRVDSGEAYLWARHFEQMEKDLDDLETRLFGVAVEQVRAWRSSGQYVTGGELVAAGLAEMLEVLPTRGPTSAVKGKS
jgi:ATP-dependent protease ClpP protease subunit